MARQGKSGMRRGNKREMEDRKKGGRLGGKGEVATGTLLIRNGGPFFSRRTARPARAAIAP